MAFQFVEQITCLWKNKKVTNPNCIDIMSNEKKIRQNINGEARKKT